MNPPSEADLVLFLLNNSKRSNKWRLLHRSNTIQMMIIVGRDGIEKSVEKNVAGRKSNVK